MGRNKASKFLVVTMAIALLLSLLSACFDYGYPSRFGFLSTFVDVMGSIFPVVDNISVKTDCASVARLSIAIQWVFFPIYLVLLSIQNHPWAGFKFKNGISTKVAKKGVIALFFVFILSSIFVLSDFGVLDISMMRGELFDPSFGYIWLRLPFSGRVGLAIASFMMPFMSAFFYWFFVYFIYGISIYFRKKNRGQSALS